MARAVVAQHADAGAVAGAEGCGGSVHSASPVLEERVLMRDGTALATTVYLPGPVSDAAQWPVLLERTPYGRHKPSRGERAAGVGPGARGPGPPRSRAEVAAAFGAEGLAVAYQDVRGRYGSEGAFRKYVHEAEDGQDTVQWLRAQPWCDGRVGTFGLSYAAHTQAALASAGTAGLAAMWLDSGGLADASQGGIRQGGVFELKQVTWAHRNALVGSEAQADAGMHAALAAVDLCEAFRRLRRGPWRAGETPLAAAPTYEAALLEDWRRCDFDAHWRTPALWASGHHDAWPASAPSMHMASWYDPYARAACANYAGLVAAGRRAQLIMGPWTHGDRSQTWAGAVDFGAAATLDGNLAADYWQLRGRWFARHMPRMPTRGAGGPSKVESRFEGKDAPSGSDSGDCSDTAVHPADPAVRYFRMGGGPGTRDAAGRMQHGGTWRSADHWPVPGTATTPLYLTADGGLARDAPPPTPHGGGDGAPAATATATATAAARVSWTHDPSDPVPSIGGALTSGEPVFRGGAFDQREAAGVFDCAPDACRALVDRPDVLAFSTPPLEAPIEVTGAAVAHLWVSSTCPDTDLVVRLVDVCPPNADYPHGFAMNIADGVLRLRYRQGWDKPAPPLPGPDAPVAAIVELFPTSNLFAAGHRIRLDLASSKYPAFDLNYGRGGVGGGDDDVRPATPAGTGDGGGTDNDGSGGLAPMVARNSVWMDALRPSRLDVPVVPHEPRSGGGGGAGGSNAARASATGTHHVDGSVGSAAEVVTSSLTGADSGACEGAIERRRHRFRVSAKLRALVQARRPASKWSSADVKGIAEANDRIVAAGGFTLPSVAASGTGRSRGAGASGERGGGGGSGGDDSKSAWQTVGPPPPAVLVRCPEAADAEAGADADGKAEAGPTDAGAGEEGGPGRFEVTDVCVANVDTLSAALALGDDTAVLSFANADTPGGRYRHGGRAQEEDLCRLLPQLYPTLAACAPALAGGGAEGGGSRRAGSGSRGGAGRGEGAGAGTGAKYPLAVGTALLVPGLAAVRRPGSYTPCRSQGCVTVIVAAMPCGVADRRPKGGWAGSAWAQDVQRRMCAVLHAAMRSGHSDLVLGAFGCGAFGNPARPVAAAWREALQLPAYRGAFRRVVFAVLDPVGTGNLRPFEDELGEASLWRPSTGARGGAGATTAGARAQGDDARAQVARGRVAEPKDADTATSRTASAERK